MTTRRDFLRATGLGTAAAALPGAPALLLGQGGFDFVLRGATVFDGTGAPGRELDVAVQGARIAAVGPRLAGRGALEFDLRGRALAPGFIDIHSHADGGVLEGPGAESVVRQGITTIVAGQDGGSRMPDQEGNASFAPFFERVRAAQPAVNVASMVGFGRVRRVVMGERDRPPTPAELARMTEMVETALSTGACGASSGLEYPPGAFAQLEELVALARPLARRGLAYATHMRNEDDELLEAIREAIAVARGAGCPLHIAHLKTGGVRNWEKAGPALALLDEAKAAGLDLSFDRYPYVAWSTGLSNRFPLWAQDGGSEAFLTRLSDPAAAGRIREETLAQVEMVGGWNAILVTDLRAPEDQGAVGRRLDEWARARGEDPYDAAAGLLRRNGGSVGTVVFAMSEANIERFLAHPLAIVASDGGGFTADPAGRRGHPHPRGLGTFPRVLGKYVRERKALTLPDAIRKMTGAPAARLRLADRGIVAPGKAADLVAFDPATVADRATFEAPYRYPEGIVLVAVNGRLALRDGERVGSGSPGAGVPVVPG